MISLLFRRLVGKMATIDGEEHPRIEGREGGGQTKRTDTLAEQPPRSHCTLVEPSHRGDGKKRETLVLISAHTPSIRLFTASAAAARQTLM